MVASYKALIQDLTRSNFSYSEDTLIVLGVLLMVGAKLPPLYVGVFFLLLLIIFSY